MQTNTGTVNIDNLRQLLYWRQAEARASSAVLTSVKWFASGSTFANALREFATAHESTHSSAETHRYVVVLQLALYDANAIDSVTQCLKNNTA